MRRTEADKKLRSILFLALGSEGKRVFTQKNPRVKILAITFSEFWTLLDAAFKKRPNTTFERYKLLSQKQKDRESYEQFWGALTDLASTCNIKESDITCKNCNYKGHFAKLCKSRNKRPTVNTVSDNYVNTENCTYAPLENSWAEDQESCDVINA